MGVNDVEHDEEAERVGLVDHVLEVVGRAVATGSREEAGHLVPEAGVVSVLHDGHDLDGVVSQFDDPREDVVGKVEVRVDLAVERGNADVTFVDAQRRRLFRFGVFHLEFLPRVPKVVLVQVVVVGQDVAGPGIQAAERAAVRTLDRQLQLGQVSNAALASLVRRQAKLPAAVSQTLQRELELVPIVEVAEEPQPLRGRRPLSHDERLVGLDVGPEILVAQRHVLDAALGLRHPFDEVLVVAVAPSDFALVELQVAVSLQELGDVRNLDFHGSPFAVLSGIQPVIVRRHFDQKYWT